MALAHLTWFSLISHLICLKAAASDKRVLSYGRLGTQKPLLLRKRHRSVRSSAQTRFILHPRAAPYCRLDGGLFGGGGWGVSWVLTADVSAAGGQSLLFQSPTHCAAFTRRSQVYGVQAKGGETLEAAAFHLWRLTVSHTLTLACTSAPKRHLCDSAWYLRLALGHGLSCKKEHCHAAVGWTGDNPFNPREPGSPPGHVQVKGQRRHSRISIMLCKSTWSGALALCLRNQNHINTWMIPTGYPFASLDISIVPPSMCVLKG